MSYPTIEEIDAADHEQICRWWRFLPGVRTGTDVRSMNRIAVRLGDLGGFTPELSKKIGWK